MLRHTRNPCTRLNIRLHATQLPCSPEAIHHQVGYSTKQLHACRWESNIFTTYGGLHKGQLRPSPPPPPSAVFHWRVPEFHHYYYCNTFQYICSSLNNRGRQGSSRSS